MARQPGPAGREGVAGVGKLKRRSPQVPDGWQLARLGDVADIVGGSTPSRSRKEFWDGNVSWVVPSELTDLQGRYLTVTKDSITNEGIKSSGLRLIPAGSVLLTSRATIGVTAINAIPVTTNQGFQNLVVKNGIDSLWLYYSVSSLRKELERRAAGSTFLEVSRDSVRSLPLFVPPLPEQRTIAAVLDSIDDAIERTEAVIAAMERLRDALLHELLTRGVPGWHTEWKEAPGVGTIPAGWEVVRLRQHCERITKGTTPTTLGRPYTSSGVRFLRVENISDNGTVAGGEPRFIDEDTHSLLLRSVLREDDLVLSIAGALGRSALITKDILPANVNQALAIVRLGDRSRLFPGFLSAVLRGPSVQTQVNDMRTELAQANISLEQVGSIRVQLPSPPEQQVMVALFDCVDEVIKRRREDRDSLQSLKASAEDALLSGSVRVLVERVGDDDE